MTDQDAIFGWAVKLWNSWDARIMIVLSLIVQFFLTFLGSQRKLITKKWIKILIWCAYLAADWIAIVALGKLSEVSKDNTQEYVTYPTSNELRALWAPLLLLHLGGPDSIIAYSLEDNHLWLRYLIGLAVQAGVTIYVIFKSWTNSWQFMLCFPLLIAGIIKYGERAWALRYSRTSNEGFSSISNFVEHINWDDVETNLEPSKETARDLKLLTLAYRLFDDLKFHIVNLISKRWGQWSYSLSFSTTSFKPDEYFKMIDFELGFIYDSLYTKASFIHTSAGYRLRLISFLLTISTLSGFFLATKPQHAKIDIAITYALMLGAVSLEVYAVYLLIFSDWAIMWFLKHHNKWLACRVLRFVASRSLSEQRWWSNSMGQFNLLNYCLYDKPSKFSRFFMSYFGMKEEFKNMLFRIIKFFDMDQQELVDYGHVSVSEDLKKFLVRIIQEAERSKRDFPKGGKWALEGHTFERDLDWVYNSEITDFKQSIVLWHIVTDICYYSDDLANCRDSQSTNYDTPHLSKMLSDYSMYLLVTCPNMFSFTSAHSDFWKDACKDLKEKLKECRPESICEEELCRILMKDEAAELSVGSIQRMLTGVLEDANGDEYSLGSLQRMVTNILENVQELADVLMQEEGNKWNVISRVWVELLCHVAIKCQVNFQVQQLSQGRELVTYLWLLLLPLAEHEEQH